MTDQIRTDYDALAQFAQCFAGQEQATEQTLQNLHGCLEQLEHDGWMGHGSDAFFAAMNSTVLPAWQRLQQALAESSQTTKQLSQDFRNAEGEASSYFGH